jgi:hypothetical protein
MVLLLPTYSQNRADWVGSTAKSNGCHDFFLSLDSGAPLEIPIIGKLLEGAGSRQLKHQRIFLRSRF